MTTFIQFALLGLGASAAYILIGSGVVLINRGSGVVNFAQAAFALVGGFLFWHFREENGTGLVLSLLIALIGSGVLGLVTYFLVMRPLANSSSFNRTVASLGVLLLLQAGCALIFGVVPVNVSSWLPHDVISMGSVQISAEPLVTFLIAVVVTLILWAASSRTRVGLALRAQSENSRTAAALGWSPDKLGALTWTAGGVLGALGGVLIAPISGLSVSTMVLFIIPVLAAVFLASFQSFPLLLAAATAIGIGQSLLISYATVTGISDGLPFLVILVYLVFRGRGLESRTRIRVRLPELGTGRANWFAVGIIVIAAALFLDLTTNYDFLAAISVTLGWGFIVLSVVVLVGFTGQLSLAQAALAGVAALTAAQATSNLGVPFLLGLLIAVVVTVVAGTVLALPALRTRGIDLAIVSLGLANVAQQMLFNNKRFTGDYGSILVPSPNVFGLDVGPILYPGRYAVFVLVVFVLACLVVSAVRRGSAGGRLLAVRNNETAAAALGVNVVGAKLFAFGLAAAIASLGGVLLAFQQPNVSVASGFGPFESIQAVAYGVVGGVGYVSGTLGGAVLAPGGFGSWVLNQVAPNASALWLQILSGAALIVLLIAYPDGQAREWQRQANAVIRVVGRRLPSLPRRRDRRSQRDAAPVGELQVAMVAPKRLEVDGISVRFGGGVVAVDDVSLTVEPGEVVALIGPNGAGKSSLIDAVSGVVRAAHGTVRLDGVDISRHSVSRRSGAGLVRSFQSLELFETITVRENLLVAADRGSFLTYLRDLVWPRRPELDAMTRAVIAECELESTLDLRVDQLSYGQRRLVAMARALAARPSVVLLDEPAAGMGSTAIAEFARVVKLMSKRWGLGVLIVEHDVAFVMGVADRIVVLEAGRHLASGTPHQVRADPAVIAAYLGSTAGDATRTAGPGGGEYRAGHATASAPAGVDVVKSR